MTTMTTGRFLWWFAFVLLILVCGSTIAFVMRLHNQESQIVQKILYSVHSDLEKIKNADTVDIKKMDTDYLFMGKDWHLNHCLVVDGLILLVVSFSGLTLFLFLTCLVERRRMHHVLPPKGEHHFLHVKEILLPL